MVELNRGDRKQLLSFLEKLPDMRDERRRRQVLIDAGLNGLVDRIEVAGAPGVAAREIVECLCGYGRESLTSFLQEVRGLVGMENQAFLDRLLEKYRAIDADGEARSDFPGGKPRQRLPAKGLAQRLQRESLERELAAYQREFEAIDKQCRRERNPVEKNALEEQRIDLLAEIRHADAQLQELGVAGERERAGELIEIVRPAFQKHPKAILLAYRHALPRPSIFGGNPCELTLETLVEDLQLRSGGETYTPVQKFAGYLLAERCLADERQARLQAWIREEIEPLSPLLEEIERAKRNRDRQGHPCLLVAVSKREGKYVAEAWIVSHPEDYDSNQPSPCCERIQVGDQTEWTTDRTLKNMPALLRQFCDVCAKKYCEKLIRRIHAFLPAESIGHRVEAWSSYEEEGELSMTFGEGYEVVVRCSERLRGRTQDILRWREKGKNMKQYLCRPAAEVFVSGNDVKPKSLLNRLRLETSIAVKLAIADRQKELGSLLLKSGIPLAVWIRHTLPDRAGRSAAIDALLEECSELRALPERVKSTRQKAGEEDEPERHVGCHIALLWDDPDLVPPKPLLGQQSL